jgi:pimeloyl-ACP methyl ester carboxylesterase
VPLDSRLTGPYRAPMRFVLVHGGLHGAWCWERVVPELEALGHEAVAIDLPGHGERVREKATLATYRGAVVEVIEDGDVVVGHSMGGLVVSMAADEVPDRIGRLVYLAAAIPIEGKAPNETMPFDDIGLAQITSLVETPEQGTCFMMTDFEKTVDFLFHDCSPEDQRWAFEHLTPQPMEPSISPIHVPRFWECSIPRNFIVCTEDRTHALKYDNEGMARLGLTTCLGMTTSHSPFISRPAELAKLLDVCASGTL